MSFHMKGLPKHLRRVLPLLLAAALAVPAGAAQSNAADNPPATADLTEMSLESLMNVTVTGASRYAQKSGEAPTYASVVTAGDIRKNGYRNLADVLRALPGIFVTNDRNYQYIGIRGFQMAGDYNSRVLLLVDGHRINNSVFDHAMIGNEFPVDIDLVERVEVVRGPGSSLYGSNAFFGVINVITKKGGDVDGAEVAGSGGRYRTYQGRATVGRDFTGGAELLVSGTLSDSHGGDVYFPEYDSPATNNGVAEDLDGEKFNNQFAKVSRGDFTLEGVRSYWKKQIPTAAWFVSFNDGRNHTVEESSYLDLRYEKDLPDGANVLARTYFDHYHYEGDYTYPPDVNKDSGDGLSWGAELKGDKTILERHRVTVGAEFRNDFRKDQENYSVGAPAPNLDSRQSSRVWAAYLQDEFRIHPKLILNAGVRHDHYSTFGGTTNPRIGLIWMPREETAVKLLYGKAFRTPNAYELYFMDMGFGMKSNPDLRPETIDTYEAVLEQHLAGLGGNWKATASFFHYRINDLITAQRDPADGLYRFVNSDPIETDGLELELEGKLAGGIEGRASYAWQRMEIRGTEVTRPNSPEHMAKLNLALPLLPGKLFFSPEGQYIGRRKNLPDKTTGHVGGYAVANATLLAKKLPWGLELSASVYNILDKEYADPAGPEHFQDSLPQDGRNYRLKASCRF
jgi:iron complex outermembrane receptor protein